MSCSCKHLRWTSGLSSQYNVIVSLKFYINATSITCKNSVNIIFEDVFLFPNVSIIPWTCNYNSPIPISKHVFKIQEKLLYNIYILHTMFKWIDMILTFTSTRKVNQLLLTPGCLCTITLSNLIRHIRVIKKQKNHKWFDFHVSKTSF